MNEIKLPLGIYAAALTPLTSDYIIDAEKYISHCKWLLQNGCDGLAVMGTTGEANSFSVDERKVALDALVQGGIDPSQLLVGTGCCSITDTVELTSHAVTHDVGGVLMLPISFPEDDGRAL